MTTPVTLYGTQSNGETLPVQVDEYGRLVAEGLQGSEGPPGPPGQDGDAGADGGAFPLPPDPYEGALLGWLNGGLAWVGSPPIVIPEGVFGPIVSWVPESAALTVEGDIPADIGTGVYVYQCDETGELFSPGWNVSQQWDSSTTGTPYDATTTFAAAFNGSMDHNDGSAFANADSTYACSFAVPVTDKVDLYIYNPSAPPTKGCRLNGSIWVPTTGDYGTKVSFSSAELGGTLTAIELINSGLEGPYLTAVVVDNQLLVNQDLSLNYRVQQIVDNVLIGSPSSTNTTFHPGKYLKTLPQRVAPWVMRSSDPGAGGMLREP